MKVFVMGIGKRIRERREAKGLTQKQLGALVKKSSQVISNWERGYTPSISHDDIMALASALETDPYYLLGITDDPTPPQSKKVSDNLYDDKRTKDKLELNEIFDKLPEEEREYLLRIAKVFESRNNQAATLDLPTSSQNGSGK